MIFTGYYAKLKQYEQAGLQPVSIAGRAPEFYKGPQYKALAPEYKMFMDWKKGKIDDDQYTEIFTKRLNTLDKEAVRNMLTKWFDKDVILLCYEKTGDFCHRHIVASWVEDNLGLSVGEYDQETMDNEKKAIEEMLDFFVDEDDLRYEFHITDTEGFLNRLKLNPPKGRVLYCELMNGDKQYTLESVTELSEEEIEKSA